MSASRTHATLLLLLFITASFEPVQSQASSEYSLAAVIGRSESRSIAWQPSGDILAVLGHSGVWLYSSSFGDIGFLPMVDPNNLSPIALSWSRDGTKLAAALAAGVSGPDDNPPYTVVYVWDIASQQIIRTIEIDQINDIFSGQWLDWSPDHTHLAIASWSDIELWNITTGQLSQTLTNPLPYPTTVLAVAWSPDGTQLLAGYDTAGDDNVSTRLWDIATSQFTMVSVNEEPALSVAWSPDGASFAAVKGKTILVWDTASTQLQRTLEGHNENIGEIRWGSQYLASASFDGDVMIWDASSDQPQQTLQTGYPGIQSLSWNFAGAQLVLVSDDSIIEVWDVISGTRLAVENRHIDGFSLTSPKWSPDSLRLLTATRTHFYVWDVRTTQLLRSIQIADARYFQSADWSSDGRQVIGGDKSGRLYVWDISLGQQPLMLQVHTRQINEIDTHPVVNQVATASQDGSIKVINTTSGQTIVSLNEITISADALRWSSEGRYLAVGDWEGMVNVFDASNWQKVSQFDVGEPIRSLDWSPNGSQLVISALRLDDAQIWDIASGQKVADLNDGPATRHFVAWNPVFSLIASTSDSTVRLYRPTDGALMGQITPGIRISDQSWSPNGKKLALTTSQGWTYIYSNNQSP